MSSFRTISRFLALSALLIAASATASTWQWRDASGRMVYSDRAPPPDIRASQIVRGPDRAAAADAAATATPVAAATAGAVPAGDAPGAAAAAARASAPRSWAERELEFRKRRDERQEAEAKQRQDRERSESASRACSDLRTALRALESGRRVAALNADGEAEPIDDAERSRRIAAARKDLAQHCQTS